MLVTRHRSTPLEGYEKLLKVMGLKLLNVQEASLE